MNYFANLKKKEIRIIAEADAIEKEKLNEVASFFGPFIHDINRTYIVKKAFEEMDNAFSSEDLAVLNSTQKDINRLAMNYLFSFRTYIDHWETYIKRLWKSDYTYLKKFKDVTASEYDNCMGYRITYRLRNYVQHCDIPISRAVGSIIKGGKAKRKVYVNRSRLINEFKEWKKEEEDYLQKQDEYFEILPLFYDAKEALLRIQEKLIQHRINEQFIQKCIEALEIIKKHDIKDGNLAIIEYFDKSGKSIEIKNEKDLMNAQMSIYGEIPRALCEEILRQYVKNQKFIKLFKGCGIIQPHIKDGLPIIDITQEITKIFPGSKYVNINGNEWQRVYESMSLLSDIPREYTSIYTDAGFKYEETRKIIDTFKRILDVLP